MKYTYYQITAVIDNETVDLFGSYEKSDCTSEKRIEGSQWRSEGYKSIKIITKQVEQAPDFTVYDLDDNHIIVNGHRYTFKNNILTDSVGDDVARFEPASRSDEYVYFVDLESGEVMHSIHENSSELNNSIASQLAAIYDNF